MTDQTGRAGSREHEEHLPPGGAGRPPDRMRAALARWLSPAGLGKSPPLWREGRLVREFSALRRDATLAGEGVPEGRGRPVLLIPGYLSGDSALHPLSRWLRDAGYRTTAAGIRINVDCSGPALASLETRLEQHVASWGERALIIGQSRGGLFGRRLARRRPDLVSGLITLGTPLLDPLWVHPLMLLNVGIVGTLGSLGVPGLLSSRCWSGGECCGASWYEAGKPLEVPFLSIYSRSDGIVDWRACLDPAARHAVVDSSHLGMAVNPAVYRLIAQELSAA